MTNSQPRPLTAKGAREAAKHNLQQNDVKGWIRVDDLMEWILAHTPSQDTKTT